MNVKPSENEEEYFAREEVERRRRVFVERQATLLAEAREQAHALHHMKCPKCGQQLEEIVFGEIRVDKCFGCEGFWLDKGEVDALQHKEIGFFARLLNVFRKS